MHRTATRQLLLAAALLGACFAAAGCAGKKQKQPASSWRIIDEGDRNPFITDNPERAGTIMKR